MHGYQTPGCCSPADAASLQAGSTARVAGALSEGAQGHGVCIAELPAEQLHMSAVRQESFLQAN